MDEKKTCKWKQVCEPPTCKWKLVCGNPVDYLPWFEKPEPLAHRKRRKKADGREPIPTLYSTGAVPGPNGTDSKWNFTKEWGTLSERYTIPAIIMETVPADYVQNTDSAKWIRGDQSAGIWSFNTTFSLSGYKLSTVHLFFEISGDEAVTQFSMNGVPFPGISSPSNKSTIKTFSVTSGFVQGINTLKFNVSFSKVFIRVRATGTAVPL